MSDGETVLVVECPNGGCGELHEVVDGSPFARTMFTCRLSAGPTPMVISTELLRFRTVRLSPSSRWRRDPR